MMNHEFAGGVWLIETTFGAHYEVKISEVSDHKGLAFTGSYRYDRHGNGMEYIGVGTFPMNEIRKMSRIGVDF